MFLLLAAMLLPAVGSMLYSQSKEFYMVPAPSENRITENASRAIIQDHLGYIWIGTIDGLNRYDGYSFRIYYADDKDSTSIGHDYISSLLEDRNGNLWVGTFGGLSLYDRKCDCFQTFLPDSTDPYSIRPSLITDLEEDLDGNLWISGYEGGLARFDQETQHFIRIPFYGNDSSVRTLSMNVTEIEAESGGGLWIGYETGGISLLKEGKLTHFLTESDSPVRHTKSILERPDGSIWLGGESGVFIFQPESESLQLVSPPFDCWKLIELDDGRLMANFNFKGIWEWDSVARFFNKLDVQYDYEKNVGDPKIYHQDENGIIWGSVKGLAKWDPYENRFRHISHQKGSEVGLAGDAVLGMDEDEQGRIYMISRPNGINRFDPETGEWENCFNNPLFDNELKSWLLLGGISLRGDSLWVQETSNWYTLNLRTGQLTKSPFTNKEMGPGLVKDNEGKYWIFRNGPVSYNPKTDHWTNYSLPKIAQDEISNGNRKIYFHEDWGLYLVINSWLFRFMPEEDRWEFLFHFDEHLVESNHNLRVMMDRPDRVWIGRNDGLCKIDLSNHTHRIYNLTDGLPNNAINALVGDAAGRIWITTNKGMSVLDPETDEVRSFDTSDGLQDEIFLPFSAFLSSTGEIYVGGVNGFNIFSPENVIPKNPAPPEVLISDFEILNLPKDISSSTFYEKDITETSRLELSYLHTTLRFSFTAIGYSQPNKNRYAYRIAGKDEQWHHLGTQRQIFLSGLPRGRELTLEVIAANHDGIWSEKPARLQIYVTPPFWETVWFRFLLVMLVVAGVISFNYFRLRNIRSQNLRLQKNVDDATAELRQRHEELAEANLQLSNLYQSQSHFFANLTHEFRTPLTLILGYLEELMQAENQNRSVLFDQIAANLQLNARQLHQLINQIMDLVKLESGQYRLQVSQGNLGAQVKSITSAFNLLAKKKGIRLEFNTHKGEDLRCWYDADVINKVVFNLLSNAFKYTAEEGEITLFLTLKGEGGDKRQMNLTLTDNGSGIPEAELPHIFERYYQAEQPAGVFSKGSGIGLSMIKQLVELHKGSIQVESEWEKGSSFTVSLPVNREDFSREELLSPDEEVVSTTAALFEPPVHSKIEYEPLNDSSVPHLLIVEDDEEIRRFVARQLSQSYRISEAVDGLSGWQAVLKLQPDLIISDVMMPGSDGMDLCAKIKSDQRTSHIPVILLTGLGDETNQIKGFESGAEAYLTKPFSRRELRVRIRKLLEQRRRLWEQFLRQTDTREMPDSLSDPDQEFIKKLNAYLETNLSNGELGVDDLVGEMNMSRTSLFKKMKHLTGFSVTQYIRDFRIRRAFELLMETNMTVSEVIFETGFNTPTYFYRTFRSKYGKSPKELIRKSPPDLSEVNN